MEATARAKFIRGAPRKMRLVADVVRKKPVSQVIAVLHSALPKYAAEVIERVVRSAVANLQSRAEGAQVDIGDLVLKTIMVDCGPTLKRGRPRAQGRYYRRLHRSGHIKVVVSDS